MSIKPVQGSEQKKTESKQKPPSPEARQAKKAATNHLSKLNTPKK